MEFEENKLYRLRNTELLEGNICLQGLGAYREASTRSSMISRVEPRLQSLRWKL